MAAVLLSSDSSKTILLHWNDIRSNNWVTSFTYSTSVSIFTWNPLGKWLEPEHTHIERGCKNFVQSPTSFSWKMVYILFRFNFYPSVLHRLRFGLCAISQTSIDRSERAFGAFGKHFILIMMISLIDMKARRSNKIQFIFDIDFNKRSHSGTT